MWHLVVSLLLWTSLFCSKRCELDHRWHVSSLQFLSYITNITQHSYLYLTYISCIQSVRMYVDVINSCLILLSFVLVSWWQYWSSKFFEMINPWCSIGTVVIKNTNNWLAAFFDQWLSISHWPIYGS